MYAANAKNALAARGRRENGKEEEIMTVKETILLAADELGLGDGVREYFSDGAETGRKEAETLLRCFNIVENEVALDYLPLYCEDEAESETGAVEYSALSGDAVRVLRVTDEWGNGVPFKLFPKYLKTQPGRVRISYTYTPKEKTFEDDSDFVLQASPRLLAYGMASEYCLACGLYEEAAVWDGKYKDALAAAYRSRPSRVMRSRRWA